jgi:hypothetical protein
LALTLRPGEALYLPRGLLHEAVTCQADAAASLHITVGFLEPCWGEALRLLLERLERADVRLRLPVPTWRLPESEARPALARALAGHAGLLAEAPSLEVLLLALMDGLVQARPPLPERGLLSPPPPGPQDRLRLSERMLHHVVERPDLPPELRWTGGGMALSPDELAWLQALVEGASAAELGGGEPALGFLRRLAAAGLLQRA